ncbi:ABC transporter ATP-binding protein [Cryomorphaceae bacterium]|nr:ABC transporter ATP-binding protein [Cryomorphaceae bacterium]
MIRAENIHKSYEDLRVLNDVSLEVKQGEVVSIVGASGAGKTTLLQILGTLDRPDSGRIFINDQRIDQLNPKKLSDFRNQHIGFIFQFHHLLPEFTALENICMPAFIQRQSKSEAEKRALELLGFLGLSDRRDHKPSELSGGEQQRVAVARALMNRPGIVFADEPSGNLDSQTATELHELFFRLRDELGQTFVIVTHNTELALMADRSLHMKDGRIDRDVPR